MKKKRVDKRRIVGLSSLIFLIILLLYLGLESLPDVDRFIDIIKHLDIPIKERSVKVYFSPQGGAQNAIIDVIRSAKKEIFVAMYYFTSRPIAQAIVDAKKRGVDVKVLLDESQLTEKFSKYKYLLKSGIDIRIDKGEGLMHNKFAIVDNRILITGSYNWTRSAEVRNRENLLIIDNRFLAERYILEFKRLWRKGKKSPFSH